MDIGIHFANFSLPPGKEIAPTLAETARVADQGGVAMFTLMDHYFQMEMLGGPAEPMLEGYTGLGYLAGLTDRMTLSLLVTGVTYRHPGLLAKIVSTVDVLSQGRAQLGIGTAWYEREHAGLGVPFPPLYERHERLAETIEVCRQMWSTEDGPFTGTHYQLAETICTPPPVRPTGIPVLIGGSGERRTLRLVAEYADACNLFGDDVDKAAHLLDVLQRHCDEVGRNSDEITKTLLGHGDPVADPDAFLTRMEGLAALGFSLVTLTPVGPDPLAWTTELVENVLPRLRSI